MPNDLYVDWDSTTKDENFAVVYTPTQRRKRFPDNCVKVMESEAAARAAANPDKHFYAAKVAGPSRSSEGFFVYFLVHWIE
jgi:hypothetical protein